VSLPNLQVPYRDKDKPGGSSYVSTAGRQHAKSGWLLIRELCRSKRGYGTSPKHAHQGFFDVPASLCLCRFPGGITVPCRPYLTALRACHSRAGGNPDDSGRFPRLREGKLWTPAPDRVEGRLFAGVTWSVFQLLVEGCQDIFTDTPLYSPESDVDGQAQERWGQTTIREDSTQSPAASSPSSPNSRR